MQNPVRCRPTPFKLDRKTQKQLSQLERKTEKRIAKYRAGLGYFAGDAAEREVDWEGADYRLEDVRLELGILSLVIKHGLAEHRVRAQMSRFVDVAAARFGEADKILDFARRLKRTRMAEYRRVWGEMKRRGLDQRAASHIARVRAAKIVWPQ